MFDYISKDGRVRVYEGSTAYWIVNLETGEEACMGDGTTFTTNDIDVSHERQLQMQIDGDTQELIDAYFWKGE